MSLARTTLSLAGVVLAVATTLAVATLWLLLTEPVTSRSKVGPYSAFTRNFVSQ
jgi:hypothetical protein